MTSDQNKDKASNADTLENGSNVPVHANGAEPGGQFVGAHGGTDASAAAQTSGSSGASPGHGMRQNNDRSGAPAEGVPGTAGGSLAAGGGAPGAGAVGGTGLGEANTADDTRGASGNTPAGTALGGDRSGGEAGGPTPSGTPAP